MKVYEIMPGSGSDYLFENGRPIARFNDLAKAEAVRARFVAEVAEQIERGHSASLIARLAAGGVP